jgi:DNA polymerase-3 subunit alpha
VNKSEENYSIDGDSIRMGLSCIKHVGAKAKAIISRRPYADEFQLIERAKLNAKQIEALVYGGAFDCFGDRAKIARQFCKQSFNEDVSLGELAMNEKEVLGFYLVYDPLSQFKSELKGCIHPESSNQPARAKIGGMVSRLKEHQAKTGPMAFVTLLTDGGEMDVIVWPSDWSSIKKMMKIGNVILGKGKKTEKGNYAVDTVLVLREQK